MENFAATIPELKQATNLFEVIKDPPLKPSSRRPTMKEKVLNPSVTSPALSRDCRYIFLVI